MQLSFLTVWDINSTTVLLNTVCPYEAFSGSPDELLLKTKFHS